MFNRCTKKPSSYLLRVSGLLSLLAIFFFITLLEAGHHHQVATPEDNCVLCTHHLSLEKSLLTNDLVVLHLVIVTISLDYLNELPDQGFQGFFSIRAPPKHI